MLALVTVAIRCPAQADGPSLAELKQIETHAIEVVQQCMPAAVGLGTEGNPRHGSAVIVSEDGKVLTAWHVIDKLPKDKLIVFFPDGRKVPAKKPKRKKVS